MQTILRRRRRRTAWSMALAAIGLGLALIGAAGVAVADEAKAPTIPPEQSVPAQPSADGAQFEDPVETFVPLRPAQPARG